MNEIALPKYQLSYFQFLIFLSQFTTVFNVILQKVYSNCPESLVKFN